MPQSFIRQVATLVKKDILLEVRQQYTFYGVLLYVASTVFVIYLAEGRPDNKTWNALFWIVQLFVCVNAVAKSFLQDAKGRMLYYYTISSAKSYIISKLVFNMLLMLAMTMVTMLIFFLLLGNPVLQIITFAGISFLGAKGLSFIFTFLAAIAAKAQQSAALMAIMGFPVIVPQLLLLNKIAITLYEPVVQTGQLPMALLLAALDILIIVLALILFPFLWKD